MELIYFIIYHNYLLPLCTSKSFETGLSTSPPFPLKHSLNSVTVQIAVFVFLCGISDSSAQYGPFFAVRGCTNDPLFGKCFDRISA